MAVMVRFNIHVKHALKMFFFKKVDAILNNKDEST